MASTAFPPICTRVQLAPVNGDLERLIVAAQADGFTLGWMHECRGFDGHVTVVDRWLPLGEDCPVCFRGCP